MPVVYDIMGAATPNHMHVSSIKNCNMLSNATGYPDCSKNLQLGVFSMLNPNLLLDLLPDHSRNASEYMWFIISLITTSLIP